VSLGTFCESEIELIYQDDYFLVVNKPAGLLSVPGRGLDKQDCLSARVQQKYSDALVVHRLDMATSGLMIFARGVEMQRQFSAIFSERKIEKTYLAEVAGQLSLASGEIDFPLLADWPNRPLQKIDWQQGKQSLTRYQLISYDIDSNSSRLYLYPVTGRTHQLRVHLNAINHPIMGDVLYGGRSALRLMLHATELRFTHPVNHQPLNFNCLPLF
jgi:tRNA pseudouridine32 synthase/23S rRNA pseudouridine746 synthase